MGEERGTEGGEQRGMIIRVEQNINREKRYESVRENGEGGGYVELSLYLVG
jgi:hypothetical protein